MLGLRVLCACAALAVAGTALAQEIRYKSAVVALTDDPALRAEFERTLVAKAREHDYDAITSYDLVPTVADVKSKDFVDTMLANGVLGSFALFGSVQKHASCQYQRPLLPLRMMCSQVSVDMPPMPVPAMRCGRIDSGGIAGGWLSGIFGGTSLMLSQMGMNLHAPSPLHSQSQEQLAAAGSVANASSAAAGARSRIFIGSVLSSSDGRSLRGPAGANNARGLAVCYGLSPQRP